MRTPKYNPETYDPQQSYSAKQLSRYDMEIAGVVVYVTAMTVLFVAALVMMLFWNETTTQAHAQISTAPAAQQRNRLAELTRPLPKSVRRAEDFNDDIAVPHAHEDLLVENVTRAWHNLFVTNGESPLLSPVGHVSIIVSLTSPALERVFSAELRRSEAVTFGDPVMPVLDGLLS